MTFIAPSSSLRSLGDVIRPLAGRSLRTIGRIRSTDEDGARRALGIDHHLPPAVLPGTSLEHLARIALG